MQTWLLTFWTCRGQQSNKKKRDRTYETIYETFIRLKLESVLFGRNALSRTLNSKQQKTVSLEKLARIVTGAKKGTSHDKLYCETEVSKLEERRSNFKFCFMYKSSK